ncbi:TPA: hypothetical protein N0F65_003783 [Lagenidium giganteum]|uniref:RanBP2-type domain-containing protein n=1 Tax=Lagenidium giganteum TaxID=4803 RepID=A0AAV2YDG5_9STRA|nr:TPA: hypothetical protein N0F65_003783 [Lagenidium giganteum]
MCESEMKPRVHDVEPNGSWKCGVCATSNGRGQKECSRCHMAMAPVVTSSAPSQIYCSRCGFLNDGSAVKCAQCDNTVRSTLDNISTDLRDGTNVLARDIGVNINVKCPGCFTICYVPPATACLRCGTCHTYFASPTIGEVTNFHMTRLASSISSSFRGFFSKGNNASAASEETEAPMGRLLALGELLQNSEDSSFTDVTESQDMLLQSEEEEEKEDTVMTVASPRVYSQPSNTVQSTEETETPSAPVVRVDTAPAAPVDVVAVPVAVATELPALFSTAASDTTSLPIAAPAPRSTSTSPTKRSHMWQATSGSPRKTAKHWSSGLPTAVPVAVDSHVHELIEVEGDIVEL